MADLQLFGRAPMAAVNGDAAQTQKEKKGMEWRRLHLSTRYSILVFSQCSLNFIFCSCKILALRFSNAS